MLTRISTQVSNNITKPGKTTDKCVSPCIRRWLLISSCVIIIISRSGLSFPSSSPANTNVSLDSLFQVRCSSHGYRRSGRASDFDRRRRKGRRKRGRLVCESGSGNCRNGGRRSFIGQSINFVHTLSHWCQQVKITAVHFIGLGIRNWDCVLALHPLFSVKDGRAVSGRYWGTGWNVLMGGCFAN